MKTVAVAVAVMCCVVGRVAAAEETEGALATAVVAEGVARTPIRYEYGGLKIQLYVVVGTEDAVGEAAVTCAGDHGRDALRELLKKDESLSVINQVDLGTTFVFGNYKIALCPFAKSSKDEAAAWTYVADLAQLGITAVDIGGADGKAAETGASSRLAEWLVPPANNNQGRVFTLSARALFHRPPDRRWAKNETGALRFHIGTTGSTGTLTSTVVSAFFKAATANYFHFSAAVFNSYGVNFGSQGKVVALPLTVAIGWDFLPIPNSNFFFGLRAVAAPSFAFAGGTLTEIFSVAVGGRLDVDGWFGIGVGVNMQMDQPATGTLFLSLGPKLLPILPR